MPTDTKKKGRSVQVSAGEVTLSGDLVVPAEAAGVVLFAHGSGSSRKSSRNRAVARTLQEAGLATLLIDLLTEEEEEVDRITRHLRFDIPMLADRLVGAVDWLQEERATADLPIGLFGASTGAAAALIAAAERPGPVDAVVSRGGRPDLAGEALPEVEAPTLLIVGERDYPVIEMNEDASAQMTAEREIEIVPRATHLFEEPGALERVADLAARWFVRHLAGRESLPARSEEGGGREEAGGDGAAAVQVFRTPEERARLIGEAAEPFGEIEETDLSALLERIGDARVVLLGEASHGTSEFYRMRQQITKALIERKGFTIIGAEADWPDAEHVDEYVRGRSGKAERGWQAFSRFPTWMWRNHEVLSFVEWLRDHNEGRDEQVGFYGLDLYSLYTSIHEVLRYLEDVDPDLAHAARNRYGCLMPFEEDPARYGNAVISQRYRDCEDEATGMLRELLQKRIDLTAEDGERFLDAAQNARVVANAERYYRVMYYGSAESWNLRDSHMFDTLKGLLSFRGPDAKAVVWAHNSHIGNAAATQMSARGEINIGHLSREEWGDDAYLIGFGTHEGTVAAASNWGGEVEIKRVRPSHARSYERLCHDNREDRFFLPLREAAHPDLRGELRDPRLERAIGVIYRPETELQSHYFQAVLPEQFDEYVWFDRSEAVRPLERATAPTLPERHPFLLVD